MLGPEQQPAQARKTLAYETLRRQIVTAQLAPGASVNEKEVAQQLGISRTPVHEAVQELVREGLLEVTPRRGTTVPSVSFEDIRQIYELRRLLEPPLLQLALPRLDRQALQRCRDYFAACAEDAANAEGGDRDADFHLFLAAAARNRYAIRALEQMMAQTQRLRSLSDQWAERRYTEACREHVAIADALLDGDAGAARQAMQAHLDHAEQGYRRLLLEGDTEKGETEKWIWQ